MRIYYKYIQNNSFVQVHLKTLLFCFKINKITGFSYLAAKTVPLVKKWLPLAYFKGDMKATGELRLLQILDEVTSYERKQQTKAFTAQGVTWLWHSLHIPV